MPEFPGGEGKLLQFIAENIHLPKCVTSATVKGRSIIEFVVEKDGTVSDFKVVRSLHKDCDEEAVRVLKTMPKWKPGRERGEPVRVKYMVPVQF
jgi:TonB family protein